MASAGDALVRDQLSTLISLLLHFPSELREVDLVGEAGVEELRKDDAHSLGWASAVAAVDSDTVAADSGYNVAGAMMGRRLSWGSLFMSEIHKRFE